MSKPALPPMCSPNDRERILEFEFVRATENAALNAIHWPGRGRRRRPTPPPAPPSPASSTSWTSAARWSSAKASRTTRPASSWANGWAPGTTGSPRFDIAMDPIDGTTNVAKGMPNSISVIAAAQVPDGAVHAMRNLPSYYSHKIAYGPPVRRGPGRRGDPCLLDMPVAEVLRFAAKALGKEVGDLVVVTMDRPRHADIIREVRATGLGPAHDLRRRHHRRGGPVPAASGVDLYVGMGGSPEGVLRRPRAEVPGRRHAAAHVVRPGRHPGHREQVAQVPPEDLERVFRADDLVVGDSALFCATGITDSTLLPGIKLIGHRAETHSILMRARSGTVRHIQAVHDLLHKTIPLRVRALVHGVMLILAASHELPLSQDVMA